jgi:hypothetical protein
MRRRLEMGIFTGLLLCGIILAQSTAPQANPTPSQDQPSNPADPRQPNTGAGNGRLQIAPGSVIPVQLKKSIDAKKVKSGETVDAMVTQDLKAQNGTIVVPKHTKVVGRVTEAQPSSKEQKESHVALTFDRVVMKNGDDAQLPMSIQAIISTSSPNPASNGSDAAYPSASGASSGTSQGSGGRPGMGTGTPSQNPTPSGTPSGGETGTPATAPPPITGDTKGVIGIPNLQLSSGGPAQGSLVTSEKGNVKLESGTIMLLRVNPTR